MGLTSKATIMVHGKKTMQNNILRKISRNMLNISSDFNANQIFSKAQGCAFPEQIYSQSFAVWPQPGPGGLDLLSCKRSNYQ
ncbi:hypothetical protein [Desulfonatronospira sp.]|uniref:hypothetical protein n=1 Tax=Desulfonatronospira sp. TaxID=1962951 RepID=UPI0025C2DA3E|nr:hypothetical protein [Desulfonatronospira sp.]